MKREPDCRRREFDASDGANGTGISGLVRDAVYVDRLRIGISKCVQNIAGRVSDDIGGLYNRVRNIVLAGGLHVPCYLDGYSSSGSLAVDIFYLIGRDGEYSGGLAELVQKSFF